MPISRRTRSRARLPIRRAVHALRARSARTKRLLFAATALCLALMVALAFSAFDSSEPVPLGEGVAGVYETATSTPLRADEIDGESEAPPPPPPVASNERGSAVPGGEASFYGGELAGRPTASGERFNPQALTAAHRSLPLGSRVRVTNATNGRSIVVRINDRGPFHGNRVIDVSEAAARQLGFHGRGTARVQIELLARG
jgi:rare lipoprotein A